MRLAPRLMSLAAALVLSAAAFAGQPAQTLVVKFHADYCGSCQAMEPAFAEVKKQNGSENVAFLVMDYTSEASTKASWEIAKAVGIQELVKAQEGKLGYALVVNRESGDIAAKLTSEHSAEQMAEAIAEADMVEVAAPMSAVKAASEESSDCSSCTEH